MSENVLLEIQEAIRKEVASNQMKQEIFSFPASRLSPLIIHKDLWIKKRQFKNTVNRILHILFSIPVLGQFCRILYLLIRLPQQIDRLRDEISYLHMERAKSEQYLTKQLEDFEHYARARFLEIEQRKSKRDRVDA